MSPLELRNSLFVLQPGVLCASQFSKPSDSPAGAPDCDKDASDTSSEDTDCNLSVEALCMHPQIQLCCDNLLVDLRLGLSFTYSSNKFPCPGMRRTG